MKKVLITGTSKGIGKAIAEKFISEGHLVLGFDRDVRTIDAPGYLHFNIDIAKKDTFPELSEISIIINNAGSLEEDEAIPAKLLGAYYITEKYAFNPCIESVLNISSNSAHIGIEWPLYVIANAGLVGYAKNLARRLAQYGATANSLSPGYVDTTLDQHLVDSNLSGKVVEQCLLKHIQKPEEVAELAYYLTAVNKSITGQDILMDCGESICSEFIETPENLCKFYKSRWSE